MALLLLPLLNHDRDPAAPIEVAQHPDPIRNNRVTLLCPKLGFAKRKYMVGMDIMALGTEIPVGGSWKWGHS